jgi:hypothetical protein
MTKPDHRSELAKMPPERQPHETDYGYWQRRGFCLACGSPNVRNRRLPGPSPDGESVPVGDCLDCDWSY